MWFFFYYFHLLSRHNYTTGDRDHTFGPSVSSVPLDLLKRSIHALSPPLSSHLRPVAWRALSPSLPVAVCLSLLLLLLFVRASPSFVVWLESWISCLRTISYRVAGDSQCTELSTGNSPSNASALAFSIKAPFSPKSCVLSIPPSNESCRWHWAPSYYHETCVLCMRAQERSEVSASIFGALTCLTSEAIFRILTPARTDVP